MRNHIRPTERSIDTNAVHAGRDDFARLGVHAPPLDLSSTYPLADLEVGTESLEALAAGAPSAPNAVYSRLYNPTVARFEEGLARLEKAPEAVSFASGMAALTACLLAAKQKGAGHVVAVRPVYGTTDHLLSSGLLGLEVTWTKVDGIAAALRPDTGLVIVETPGNPTLSLVDIRQVVEQAGSVPVLVDSTFATPVLQNPFELGARLVLHSATKFLGGHGDVLAGVVATDEEWGAALRQIRVLTGAVLHPLAGYLLHRGLTTLPVRVRAAQEGARVIARRLAAHPAVERVLYPGLPDGDPQGLVGRQMRGPGTMIAFEVRGGHDVAAMVLRELDLITPAVSLGSTDSLIQHPAGLTHRLVSPEGREAGGITEGMLRLSVGLEDPADLLRDLEGALNRASGLRFETESKTEAVAAGG